MKYWWFIIILSTLNSCVEYPEYPDEPKVEYMYATPYLSEDALGNPEKNIRLHFMLYDGNGDVGRSSTDTTSKDFFSTFYVKKNGVFVEFDTTKNGGSNYKIPQIRETDNDKFIKAEVTVDIPHTASTFPYDTVYFTFYVEDRAGNMSNIDTSNVLIFN